MRGWLRRIRGAVGMGLTWALGWAPIGVVAGAGLWLLGDPLGRSLGNLVEINGLAFGLLGFVGGSLFSVGLRLTEGRRRFDELTIPRFSAWGGVGGLAVGAFAGVTGLWGASGYSPLALGVACLAAALGAGSAATTLVLAQRGESSGLIEPADVEGAGLSETEVRELLG